jgi:hypothetical protein
MCLLLFIYEMPVARAGWGRDLGKTFHSGSNLQLLEPMLIGWARFRYAFCPENVRNLGKQTSTAATGHCTRADQRSWGGKWHAWSVLSVPSSFRKGSPFDHSLKLVKLSGQNAKYSLNFFIRSNKYRNSKRYSSKYI